MIIDVEQRPTGALRVVVTINNVETVLTPNSLGEVLSLVMTLQCACSDILYFANKTKWVEATKGESQ